MSDDLARIADAWRGVSPSATDLYITCARGLSPRQLAEGMADHEPVEVEPALTIDEASSRVDLTQIYCVGRIGQSGDWSFIVECGGSEGWALDPAVSLDTEVLIFDPPSAEPSSFFSYLADGEVQLHFELGSGYHPAGARPDLLRPAPEAAGAIPPEESIDDLFGPDEEMSPFERTGRTLGVVGEHFSLSLPRQVIERGRLPAVVTRTSPPSSWLPRAHPGVRSRVLDALWPPDDVRQKRNQRVSVTQ